MVFLNGKENSSQNIFMYTQIFLSPFLFANCTNVSTFSKWCDRWRGRERGAHQHPFVIRGAKLGVEVGNEYI
jgi:hypothetical protein